MGLTGRSTKRCELGRQYGAVVLDVRDPAVDVINATLESNARGVDVVFDCVGSQVSWDQSLATVKRGGTIVNLAAWREKPVVDMTMLVLREVNIISRFQRSLGRSDVDHNLDVI